MTKQIYSAPQISVHCVETRKVVCQSPYGMEGQAGKEIIETDGGSLFSVLLLVGLLLFGGCAKFEAPQSKPEANQKTIINLTSQQTRTTVAYDSVSCKFKPSWTAGDQLGVFIHDGSQYVGAVKNKSTEALTAACEKASFSLESQTQIAKGTYDLYAYYPYNESESGFDNAKVIIPTVQWPANGSFDPGADVLSAAPIKIDVNDSGTINASLQFARKTAIIRLLPDYSGTNAYVDSIIVTMNKKICGDAHWDISTTSSGLVLGENASSSVTIKYPANTHRITDPI